MVEFAQDATNVASLTVAQICNGFGNCEEGKLKLTSDNFNAILNILANRILVNESILSTAVGSVVRNGTDIVITDIDGTSHVFSIADMFDNVNAIAGNYAFPVGSQSVQIPLTNGAAITLDGSAFLTATEDVRLDPITVVNDIVTFTLSDGTVVGTVDLRGYLNEPDNFLQQPVLTGTTLSFPMSETATLNLSLASLNESWVDNGDGTITFNDGDGGLLTVTNDDDVTAVANGFATATKLLTTTVTEGATVRIGSVTIPYDNVTDSTIAYDPATRILTGTLVTESGAAHVSTVTLPDFSSTTIAGDAVLAMVTTDITSNLGAGTLGTSPTMTLANTNPLIPLIGMVHLHGQAEWDYMGEGDASVSFQVSIGGGPFIEFGKSRRLEANSDAHHGAVENVSGTQSIAIPAGGAVTIQIRSVLTIPTTFKCTSSVVTSGHVSGLASSNG